MSCALTGRAPRPRRRVPRPSLLAFVGVATLVAVAGASLPAAGEPGFVPPSDAPVVEGFAPPDEPWLSGRRGVVVATRPGEPVVAVGAGVVSFAGPVAGTPWVTVAHAGGRRTSTGPLDPLAVAVGDVVAAGQTIGWATGPTHLGLRDATGAYLDPRGLWSVVGARLVPGGDDGARVTGPGGARWDAAGEPLASLAAWTLAWPGRLPGLVAARAHWARSLHPLAMSGRLATGLVERARPRLCSPASVAPPPPAGRRVLVLVAGFGSSSDHASIDDLDAGALGYQPGDVVRFSYAGGRIPSPHELAPGLDAVPARPYGVEDSQRDLVGAGTDLRALLAQVAEAAPGVPVDVVAHSQGGVVTRLALAGGSTPDSVDLVATVGSPHDGADLATAAAGLAGTPGGSALLATAHLAGAPPDPTLPALAQLSETSPVVAGLAGRELPAGVRGITVAARGDLVVPAGRAGLPGVTEVVLPLGGPAAHGALPGDDGTARAIGLARAGLPPACETAGDQLADVVLPELVGSGTDLVGWGLSGAGGP